MIEYAEDEVLKEACRREYCQWTEDEDEDGTWDTACGHCFEFNDGGPAENYQRYCGYCGGTLIVNSYIEPPIEEDL